MNSTRTRPSVDCDVRITPRSTSEIDRNLGIGDLGERVPDLFGSHHAVPAGCERRTIVISSHSSSNSGVCRLAALRRSAAASSSSAATKRGSSEPVEPHLSVQPVVGLLAVDLRREAGKLRIVRLLQLFEPLRVRLLVEERAERSSLPVGQAQLDEPRAAVLGRLPVERELVRVVPSSRAKARRAPARGRSRSARSTRRRRPLRAAARSGPLGVAPAEDQLVVGDLEQRARSRSFTRRRQLLLQRIAVDPVVVAA